MKQQDKASYTAQQVGKQLRSAVVAAARTTSGPIDPKRYQKIREAACDVLLTLDGLLCDGDLATPEELVLLLSAAAFLGQTKYVLKQD